MTEPLPLLRAPPFPGVDASVSRLRDEADAGRTVPDDERRRLFSLVREARVGGRFWADPLAPRSGAAIVVRPRRILGLRTDLGALSREEQAAALWVAPSGTHGWSRALERVVVPAGGAWVHDADPWSVLDAAGLLVAHGDDEWIALARIARVPVRVLSAGRFGDSGDDESRLDALAACALLEADYRDPFIGGGATIEQTIDLLATWRGILTANRPIAAACGMAWWKRDEIRRFLWSPNQRLRQVRGTARALAIARKAGGAVAIWPSRVSPTLIADARRQGVPLIRVEDGFVRSVGLGVELVPPSSVVVDASGIHFDPSGPSDLETLLRETDFTPGLLERARRLRETIVTAGISKYAADAGADAALPARQPDRRLVLVPGQVGDDMSVLAGGGGMTSSLELLRRAREREPEAEIWFRPHPDVDAGHRTGAVPDEAVLGLADRIVRGGGMAPLLDAVDAVHVLTSLTGFEALMRGREVICHGTPFYAGWGLTRDLGPVPDRRGRMLTLDALVAGVLILYPRYLDPVTGLPCPPEVLVGRMATASATNRLGWIAPLRRGQGRLMALLR